MASSVLTIRRQVFFIHALSLMKKMASGVCRAAPAGRMSASVTRVFLKVKHGLMCLLDKLSGRPLEFFFRPHTVKRTRFTMRSCERNRRG